MFEVYGLIIPENADAMFAFEENIDELYMIDELLDISELVWKKQKYYYLTFHANSGTGTMPDQTMPCGTAAALSANLFSRIGYLFQGWNPDASGGAVYTDGQEVTDIAGAGETLTLYAIWKAITWYVKFHANGGSGSMANQAHAYDKELALTVNAFTRSEYTFLGWGTTASGAVAYGDKQAVKNLKSVHGAVLNLYAIWQKDPWTVVFTDYPITITSSRGSVKTAETLSSGYKLNAKKDGNSGSNGQVKASVSLPTQGCNKVDVSYRCVEVSHASINGTSIVTTFTHDVSGEVTLSCSGDTLELNLQVDENTAYYTASLQITNIYFYNE